MPSNLFLQLRLVGNRFEGHSIPFDFLSGLAPLQALIVEAAKIEYLRKNESRKRVPKGFERSIELKLTSLRHGSVQLDVDLAEADNLSPIPNQGMYVMLARDSILATIHEAEKGDIVEHSTIPKKMLSHFEKIASVIADDEEIHFVDPAGSGNGSVSARFSKQVANRLVNAATKGGETTQDIEIRGSISELDQASMTLKILPVSGRKLEASIPPEQLHNVLEVFNGFRRGSQAEFHGTGRLDPAGRVVAFTSLSQVEIIDKPSDISRQLDDIRALEHGWLDGEGRAPSQSGIDWIESRLHRYLPADLPRPYLYPTEAGGVQLEWSIESNEVSIEVDLESHLGIWHELNLNPQQNLQPSDERERELNLDQSSAWEWIIHQINGMRRIQ